MAPITRTRSQESTSEDLDSENPKTGVNDGTGEIEFDHSSFWKDNSIQVVLRIRPLSGNEISQQGHNKCIRPDSYQSLTWLGHPESRFTFDIVADEHVTQEKLFKVAGLAMVDNCMAGYNSCMFAYGQTGSGKTHTMLGDIENGTRRHNENCGMTPRVFEYLFQRIQKEKEMRKEEKLQFTCKCSFLEIYNELIYDLLDPNSTNLQIREDLKKGVYVENLKEYEVSSAREAMQQLIEGAANRKVAATNMNRASSRSHSIFTCIIESKWEVQGLRHHRFARLNLVDLAGSERQKSSGAEGERLKEATNINKSLSTLGLVIMNLTVSNKKSVHVPYRDSKLTFLLQDSLGGNSKTTIIANISPSNCCALETLSTLKFAQRAKFIKNNAIVNEDASGDVITMRLQIQQLKKEVNELRGLGHTRGSNNAGFESPYMLKLDGGIHGNFSPLTLDKRLSQKKESEAALVAAIRREHEKEASLRAMHTAKRTAEELVTQREEEIKSLKMRLRFREEGIKRLQKVSSGKLSSESHLMAENQELRKEIENLKSQLDRNPEITRFAMENLHLTEELRRLKAFVEEGERERMNEHITVLQDKLLEALDWKLMNEKDPFFGRENSFLLEPPSNEENEFLQLQAIQKEHEIELLRKKLNLAVQEKENLQRNVEELASQLENEKSARISKQDEESNTEQIDAETELKTLVAAIANASQREAEAHETAISLAKEIESLRLQLHAIAENSSDKDENIMRENEELRLQMHAIAENSRGKEKERLEMLQAYDELMEKYENAMREKEELRLQIVAIMENSRGGEKENLGVQLSEMHQENDKLMLMYENAMIEREEAKRLVREFEERNEELRELVQEKENLVRESQVRENLMPVEMEVDRETGMDLDGLVEMVRVVRDKLGLVQDKLGCTDRVVNHLGLTEKAFSEIDELSRSIRASRENVQPNLVQLAQYNNVLSEKQRKKNKVEKWFSVHVTELETSNSKTSSLAEKVTRIEAKINEVRESNDRKSDEIKSLEKSKDEINSAYRRARENEAKLWGKIDNLKASISDAECLKKEREKVLLEVNSMKALDLMKSEMERNKLSLEIKNFKEQLRLTKKEISSLTKSKDEVDSKVKALEEEIRVGSLYAEEGKIKIVEIGKEMEVIRITREDLKGKMDRMLPEYFKAVFDVELKVEEIKACEESVRLERRELVELEEKLNSVLERMRGLLCERQRLVPVNGTESGTVCVAEIVSKRIEEVRVLVNEAKELSLVGLINVT